MKFCGSRNLAKNYKVLWVRVVLVYRKKVILGTQLLQTDRQRRQTTTANGGQREILIFYLDEVCASFILVLMVQIVHTKKPRLTSKQNEAHVYVGTVQGLYHRYPISLDGGSLCLPRHSNHF